MNSYFQPEHRNFYEMTYPQMLELCLKLESCFGLSREDIATVSKKWFDLDKTVNRFIGDQISKYGDLRGLKLEDGVGADIGWNNLHHMIDSDFDTLVRHLRFLIQNYGEYEVERFRTIIGLWWRRSPLLMGELVLTEQLMESNSQVQDATNFLIREAAANGEEA